MKNRNTLWILIIFAVFSSLFLKVQASNLKVEGAPIFFKMLDNGLKVAIMENHASPVVALRIFVNTGSIYEGKYTGCGISHYFEHLLAGGTTKTRTEEECEQILRKIGASKNAYTTKNLTCYFITTTAEHFDTALKIYADWMMNNILAQKEVNREKGVILKEIMMGENEPYRVLFKLKDQLVYNVSPMKHPVIGYTENFKKITRDDLLHYYKTRYSPNNTVIVVVGDVDTDETFKKIKNVFKNWKRQPLAPKVIPEEPEQVSYRYAEKEMDTNVTYMLMIYPTVPLTHPDLYPLDLLSFILSRGRSSRLYKKIKDKLGLVYSVVTYSATPSYARGEFGVRCILDYKNLKKAEEAIKKEIYKLKTEKVTENELQKAKTQKISAHYFSQQNVEDQAEDIGWNIIGTNDPYFSRRYVENIQKVTPDDIMRVVNKYFNDNRLSVAVVKPIQKTRKKHKKAKKSLTIKPKKYTLKNGIRLIVKNNPVSPTLSIQAWCLAGVRAENEKNNGIGNFMARMLVKGTKNMSAEEIAKQIDSMGASLKASGGNNSFGITLDLRSCDFEKGYKIFHDCLINPAFEKKEMDKLRKEIIADIKKLEDNWQWEAELFFYRKLFKKHPYRFHPFGKIEVIKKLTPEDLKAWHKKFVKPSNIVIAIFGKIQPEQAYNMTKKLFGNIPPSRFVFPKVPKQVPLKTDEFYEKKNNKNQVVICLGYRGVSVKSKDRFALRVIDALTSGVGLPSGWLHQALRGQKNNLVYFVHAIMPLGYDPHSYFILTQTSPENYAKVLSLIKEQQNRIMKKDACTSDELISAKNIAITYELLSNQTNSAQATDAALSELYGLGYNFKETYAQKIKAVTKEDIYRVANKYFGKNKSLLVVIKPKNAKTKKNSK